MAAAHADAAEILRWSRGLFLLSRHAPNRLSLPQAAIFLAAAVCDRAGHPGSISSLKETLGPVAGRSVKNSYQVFLDPKESRFGKLGWLRRSVNPLDARERLLKLTPKGRKVIDRVAGLAKGQ